MLVVIIVFVGVFAVLALLLFASGSGASQQNQADACEPGVGAGYDQRMDSRDQMVDIRKSEVLSAVPVDQSLAAEDGAGAATAHRCCCRPI